MHIYIYIYIYIHIYAQMFSLFVPLKAELVVVTPRGLSNSKARTKAQGYTHTYTQSSRQQCHGVLWVTISTTIITSPPPSPASLSPAVVEWRCRAGQTHIYCYCDTRRCVIRMSTSDRKLARHITQYTPSSSTIIVYNQCCTFSHP